MCVGGAASTRTSHSVFFKAAVRIGNPEYKRSHGVMQVVFAGRLTAPQGSSQAHQLLHKLY